MDEKEQTEKSDRWWGVAIGAAIIGTVLVLLLWNFPTSKWVWLLAGFILVFVAVLHLNPRYRYWRRANWCFGIAGVLAFAPSFVAKAHLEGIGAFDFASDSSSLVVLGFLATGLGLAYLDSRQQVNTPPSGGVASKNTNLQASNSPHAVTELTAGGNIIVNQGISEATFLAVLDLQRHASHVQASSVVDPPEVDEELLWRLIDDIRDARRKLDQEQITKLLSSLLKSFERSGALWPKLLRTESLLLLAEEERTRISRSRVDGNQVDLSRLQVLLKELLDA